MACQGSLSLLACVHHGTCEDCNSSEAVYIHHFSYVCFDVPSDFHVHPAVVLTSDHDLAMTLTLFQRVQQSQAYNNAIGTTIDMTKLDM